MYNTSLAQFLELFDYGIDFSTKAQLVKDRVQNIIGTMTYKVYRYVNRGIFEEHKVMFKLMVCLKVMIQADMLTPADTSLLLKAGAGIDDRNKKYSWMDQKVWLNILALSRHKFGNDHTFFFKELPERIGRAEKEWKNFFAENEPEKSIIPDYEDKIIADPNVGHFLRLCLIRCVREDRTVLATNDFIKSVLGQDYVAPVTDLI